MDPLFYNRFTVVTGTPQTPATHDNQPKTGSQPEGVSFRDILQQQIRANSSLEFSKHAVNRVVQRNIDISESKMARLNEGVRMAEEKGLNEPLILVDSTAFIVNVKNNTVITTVSSNDLKGNVFTNIDGTVII
ncbi:flagellar operon protein [Hydrogenoanaerobacterium saccharovorans]|uniref:Flagellar operon protein n=1 Tax=Hydrogenoanaerobacterium saccharovorans TaxID=474960 RepID=A0A1H7ZTA9_9FIRM|nr:TIGR02530 family flagellar biosynthesis protein [Hydrogenoanaerobacterium saccharovorans]RPF48393.1 flagellar operon protein [Hydrogenoanaerobacterium saccharovorans]SEM61655.1 flagellar operon protein [Hydrogenoanaerobacterium saccharovorans]